MIQIVLSLGIASGLLTHEVVLSGHPVLAALVFALSVTCFAAMVKGTVD